MMMERDTLQQRVKELEEINARWVEKYNYDYDRVVPMIRKAAQTGEKPVSVQDTVIAIGKLMDEVERLKNS